MKIVNIKFNFKLFIFFICTIILILSSFFLINLFNNNTIIMNNENYTQILKKVHDNPNDYIDKKIITSGYIFRVNDFNENQFVVARDMIVSNDDYRIVGFLCENDNVKSFENNVWVEIKGVITLKDYHGTMPAIEVYEINRITTPNQTQVFPPKNSI